MNGEDFCLLDQLNEDVLERFLPVLLSLYETSDFSIRELILIANHIDPMSPGYNHGLKSAELAGFTGGKASLAAQASKTLRKAREHGLFDLILARHGVTLATAAERVNSLMHAQRKQAFLTESGQILVAGLGDDHHVQLDTVKFVMPLLLGTHVRNVGKKLGTGSDKNPQKEQSQVALPADLSAGEQQARQRANVMDPRARMLIREAIAAQEEVIRAWVKVAEAEAAASDNIEPEGGTASE